MEKKTILIAGGCGVIGQCLVKNFLMLDYNIIVCDVDHKKILKIKKRYKDKVNILFLKLDISRSKNIYSIISKSIKKFGDIFAFINCTYPKHKIHNIGNLKIIDEKNIFFNLNKHLGGAIIFSLITSAYLEKKKEGVLINFASIQGLGAPKFEHYKNLNMHSPIEYSAIKSGIITITKYLAKMFKNKNIRINCISPGGINSKQPKLFKKRYKLSCINKGLLDASDIFPLVEYLVNDKSKYLNGQNIIIDDGWSL